MNRPRTFRPSTAYGAAAAGVLLLALAGCGGDGDEPSADKSAEPSVSATPTPSGETEPVAGAPGLAELIETTLTEGGSAHVVMDIGDGAASAEGDIDLTADPVAMDISLDTGGQEARMLVVHGKAYLRTPDSDGTYVEMAGGPQGLGALGFDPSQLLEQARSLEGGERVAEGHYRFQESGATVDMYFGDDDLLERVTVAGGPGGGVDVRWSDWGEPVKITAPDPDQVTQQPAQ